VWALSAWANFPYAIAATPDTVAAECPKAIVLNHDNGRGTKLLEPIEALSRSAGHYLVG